MTPNRFVIPVVLTLGLAGVSAPASAGEEDIDLLLGQDGSPQHKLVVTDPAGHHFLSGELIELSPGDGLNDGYFVREFPGWSAEDGFPDPLLDGHELTLNRISSTNAAFDMLDPFTGTPILGADSDSFLFPFAGGPGHEDLFYRADGTRVNVGEKFSVNLELTDPSRLQTASDPFVLSFVIVPDPATLILLCIVAFTLTQMQLTRSQSRAEALVARAITLFRRFASEIRTIRRRGSVMDPISPKHPMLNSLSRNGLRNRFRRIVPAAACFSQSSSRPNCY